MPEPSAMPLSMRSATPNGGPVAARQAATARAAVLRSGSRGRSVTTPVMASTRTVGSAMRRAVTRSPAPARLWPRMSKPTATLPTEAGAWAVASVRMSRSSRNCGQWGTHVRDGLPFPLQEKVARSADEGTTLNGAWAPRTLTPGPFPMGEGRW